MAYRTEEISPGHIYHVYNRGVNKETVFSDAKDKDRFLQLLTYYLPRGKVASFSISKKAKRAKREKLVIQKVARGQGLVDLLCYCIMDNHIHLLLYENSRKGIATYLQRILNSYAKYFNTRHERQGPLFSGRFRAKLVEKDEYFLHVSRYIHLNPFIAGMVNDPVKYEWSSLAEYSGSKKNLSYCHTGLLEEMMTQKEHIHFVTDYANFAHELDKIKDLTLE